MKTFFLLSLLIGFGVQWSQAQYCEPNAGIDSFVCQLTYLLQGEPLGGSWTYECKDSNQVVQLAPVSASSAQASVARCGEYTFVYTVVEVDTIVLSGNIIFLDTLCMGRFTNLKSIVI